MVFARWALAAGAVVALASSALADEGMWTFDNFPAAAVKSSLGVSIDQAWLDRIRGAAVRLSTGCSASVVTGQGLVLTNHHCVRDCAQDLSTAKTDYVKDGFAAAAREDEKLCAGMQAEILTSISDVTDTVSKATAGKTGQDFVKARDAIVARLEKDGCAGREAQFRCQVVNLYQGGQYKLYAFRKYSDVRLVFAPEMQTAFFGGDPDNFNFPRYDLDFSLVRLYENGKPVVTPDHLRWRAAPPVTGEPVFVVGNPGATSRLLTVAQLQTLRDLTLPDSLVTLAELRGRLIRFGEESAEHARIADDMLFGTENSFKALHGYDEALLAPGVMAAKASAESDLKSKVAANPQLAKDIGDPWRDLESVQVVRRNLYYPYTYMEARAGFGSKLFGYGRTLVRAAQERPKPDGDRLREYRDSQLPLVEKTVLDPQPVYPELEQMAIEFWLSKLRENLTADAPGTKTFLGSRSPEERSAALVKSKLSDPAFRKSLWDGELAAVRSCGDPMIRFILATDAASRAARKAYEDRVSAPTDRAQEKIAKARFAIYGTGIYPDATFSLRISTGKVEGWTEKDAPVSPFTRFAGLWQRATGRFPFDLAPRWQAAKGKLDDDTVFDFVTDNDVIGGNSGSPAIDAKGDVIGAVFDGNIESLGGNYYFDDQVNRTVAVSTAAITEALKKVYGQDALVKELTAP